MVDGKPFFPLGGECLHRSGYNVLDESEIEINFKAANLSHSNTVEFPIYWDEVEPEEGKFNFKSVDTLLSIARRYKVKLILLWFATWYCGNMDYAPPWMKINPQRYKRVMSPILPDGKDVWVLSSHCKANLEADKQAFNALCKYLKVKDSTKHTVIGIQVENEAGIIGSDRDYGPEAQAEFDSPVPAKLMSSMKAAGKGEVYDLWQQAGGKKSGNWPEIFGPEAGELLSAWSLATYINAIAKAGKTAYDIPMFINPWISIGSRWWPIPGEGYPAGGAVHKVLDIYKWFTPDVDFIGPDNYVSNIKDYELVCTKYARDDNPLFMPEALCNLNMLRAIADYDAIGYFVQFNADVDGLISPSVRLRNELLQCVAAAIPLLIKYQGTGKVHAVVQEAEAEIAGQVQHLDLEGYMGLIEFGEQRSTGQPEERFEPWERGGGLVIQASKNEFYLVGQNYRFLLRPKPSLGKPQAVTLDAEGSHPKWKRFSKAISVDEGYFNQNGEFVPERRREIIFGVWVRHDAGVIRVITCD